MFFHKSDLAVILHSLELLSPSRARRHRGHGLHSGHGSSRLDDGLVRHEPEENSGGGGGGGGCCLIPGRKVVLSLLVSPSLHCVPEYYDGGWKMADKGWYMEDGRWRMEDGESRLSYLYSP